MHQNTATSLPAGAEEGSAKKREILSAALRTAADVIDLQHDLLTRIRAELIESSGSVSIELAGNLCAYLDDLDTEVA